jgi:hypothetical protein
LLAIFINTNNFGGARFALANHRLQRQYGRVVIELKLRAQRINLFLFHLNTVSAFQ